MCTNYPRKKNWCLWFGNWKKKNWKVVDMYSHRALDEKKQFISRNEHKWKTHMESVQNCRFSLSICKFVTLFSSSRRSCLRKHKSIKLLGGNSDKRLCERYLCSRGFWKAFVHKGSFIIRLRTNTKHRKTCPHYGQPRASWRTLK